MFCRKRSVSKPRTSFLSLYMPEKRLQSSTLCSLLLHSRVTPAFKVEFWCVGGCFCRGICENIFWVCGSTLQSCVLCLFINRTLGIYPQHHVPSPQGNFLLCLAIVSFSYFKISVLVSSDFWAF